VNVDVLDSLGRSLGPLGTTPHPRRDERLPAPRPRRDTLPVHM